MSYNGWTNYETWRINLEVLDGMTVEDFGVDISHDNSRDQSVDYLAGVLEDYVWETLNLIDSYRKGAGNLVDSLAMDFLRKVNWHEIAEHLMEDYLNDNPSKEQKID